MKLAHLILVHNSPEQVERLINKLVHPKAFVYIHVDKKTPMELFSNFKKIPKVVFIQNRVSINWGSYSMVQATLNGFTEIVNSKHKFDYINLLSGSDYPIKSTNYIHKFLKDNPDKAFTEFYLINKDWQEAIPRLKKYHLGDYKFAGKYLVQRWLNHFLPERKIPKGLIPVGRSQWLTLSEECVIYIINFLKKNKNVERFFKLTWGCDEYIFQTILYNSHLRPKMINNNLRLIKFFKGEVHPKTYTYNDMNEINNSDKFFVRKVDLKIDAKIFDLIDQNSF